MKHHQTEHGALSDKFSCMICNQKFVNEDVMNQHIQNFHKVVLINNYTRVVEEMAKPRDEKQVEKKALTSFTLPKPIVPVSRF